MSYSGRGALHAGFACLQMVASQQLALECLRTEVLPRRKFRFTNRHRLRKSQFRPAHVAAAVPVTAAPSEHAHSDAGTDEYSIRGISDATVVIVPGQLAEGQDIRLEDLKDCVVHMYVVLLQRSCAVFRCIIIPALVAETRGCRNY